MFAAFGAAAVLIALRYPVGTTMRMGPGYFPSVLGWILLAFGTYLMWRGSRLSETVDSWGWRALGLVTLAMVVFGFTVTRLGLIPALTATLVLCALAGRGLRWKELLALVVVLNAFAVVLFVGLLKLPFRIFLDWYW